MALPKPYFDLAMEVTQGDPVIISMVFEDDSKNPVDIDTWDFFYTIKASLSDSDDEAVAKLRPGDSGIVKSAYPSGLGFNNRVDLILEPVAGLVAGNQYFHDVQVVPDDGRPYTYAKGKLVVTFEVTEDEP